LCEKILGGLGGNEINVPLIGGKNAKKQISKGDIGGKHPGKWPRGEGEEQMSIREFGHSKDTKRPWAHFW